MLSGLAIRYTKQCVLVIPRCTRSMGSKSRFRAKQRLKTDFKVVKRSKAESTLSNGIKESGQNRTNSTPVGTVANVEMCSSEEIGKSEIVSEDSDDFEENDSESLSETVAFQQLLKELSPKSFDAEDDLKEAKISSNIDDIIDDTSIEYEYIYSSESDSPEVKGKKKELLNLAEGYNWRTVPQLPKELVSGIQTIVKASKRKVNPLYKEYHKLCGDLKYRSDLNMRIALHKMEESHSDSRELAEQKELHKEFAQDESTGRNSSVEDKMKAEQVEATQPFVYCPARTISHTAFRMPLAYSTTKTVLKQIRKRAPHFQPHSVLDFGSGPGTSLWAAQDVWPTAIDECIAIEPSQSMSVVAQALMKQGFTGPSPRWFPSLTNIAKRGRGSSARPFSLVIASNVFGELPTDGAREAALRLLWQLVANDGMLVLVEPGSRWGSRCIQDARSTLIEKAGGDMSIIAPCTHMKKCPLALNTRDSVVNSLMSSIDEEEKNESKEKSVKIKKSKSAGGSIGQVGWFTKPNKRKGNNKTGVHCHFPQRGPEPPIKPDAVEARSTVWSSKFSYLSAVKSNKETFDKNVSNGLETDSAEYYNNEKISRLLGHPIKRKGHVIMDLCNADGNTERRIVTKGKLKKQKDEFPGAFRAARKATWGGAWPHRLMHDRKEAYSFVKSWETGNSTTKSKQKLSGKNFNNLLGSDFDFDENDIELVTDNDDSGEKELAEILKQ